MQIVIDTKQIKVENIKDIIENLLKVENTHIDVIFHDKTTSVKKKYIILSLFYWNILIKWGVEITSDICFEEIDIDNSQIAKMGTKVIDVIKKKYNDPSIINNLNFDLWILVNEIMNFSIRECQEYVSSVNIRDLAKIKKSVEVTNIVNSNSNLKGSSILTIETVLKDNSTKLYEILKNKELTYLDNKIENVLFPLVSLKFINLTQLHHIFNAIGFRTDIDDSIVSLPIMTGYLDGLKNNLEYMAESLSAKKSAFYTMKAIPNAQYFLRKQHLLVSAISKIYPGDCGSRIPLEFMITEKNYKNVIWKNIIMENGDLLTLTPDNIKHFIDNVVKLKSICFYTDGICKACGGKLVENMSKNTNIGVFSSMQVAAPVVQRILSDKHFQQTMSIEYDIPKELKFLLKKTYQDLIFRESVRDKIFNLEFGFIAIEVKKILNLGSISIESIDSINEISFGDVQSIFIRNTEQNGNRHYIENEIKMGFGTQTPYFSREFIMYVKRNPNMIKIENNIMWVSFEKFAPTEPIFKTKIINDSMVHFVNGVKKFIETQIKDYTSMEKALMDFSNLIYHKVDIPLVFIEIMLRAYTVKNNLDLNIPPILDPKNVMFRSNMNINQQRSLGGLFAYERLAGALLQPSLFLIPKKRYMFDYYLNYKKRRG